MPGNIILVGEKGANAAQLENAFVSVHDGQLVHRHQRLAQLGIVQAV